MQDKVSNDLINRLPIAYASHKLIYDEHGVPTDYEFVEVNHIFETMVSRKAADIIGKRVTQVLPDLKNDKFNWIKTFGDVVLKNTEIEIDEYSESLGKWFKVFAHSPYKDHFVTMFLDISDKVKKADEQLAMYKMLNDIIFEIDETYCVLNVLASDETLLFAPKEVLIGKTVMEILPERLSDPLLKVFEKAKCSGEKESISYQSIIPDENKWFRADIRFTDINKQNRYIVSVHDITEKMLLEQKTKESELLFRTVFEQAPFGIEIVRDHNQIISINSEFEKILGRTKEELMELDWREYTHPDDLKEEFEYLEKFYQGEIPSYSMIKRYIRKDGSFVWVYIVIAHIKLDHDSGNNSDYICMAKDISDSMSAERALRESERSKSVILAHLPGMAYRCRYDKNWTMEFVSEGCFELTGYRQESLIQNKDIAFNDIISPEYQDYLWDKWPDILNDHSFLREEYEIITSGGEKKWVLEQGQGIYDSKGSVLALEGLIIDITASKNREIKIGYLNDHDTLSDLYNRRYFFDEMERMDNRSHLPFSIIVGDINGIRLINHAFGNENGDSLIKETAKIMKKYCRSTDVLSRISGGNFGILMPDTDIETASYIMNRIKSECESFSQEMINQPIQINISFGCSAKNLEEEKIADVYSVAEDNMYKRKLLDRKNSHGNILTAIMATLVAKSQETEKHAKRLAELSKMIGLQFHLPQKNLDLLELFAMLHDVGKIGIDDQILNKKGKLDKDEWETMKMHPEIGYKIAISSPELESVADYILTHHEHWNGKGYPQGLKGEEIPLLSRILAVVDAYDAMTEDRIYRKASSKEEAISEINRCSETQFDPKVVEAFNKIMKMEKNLRQI